MDDRSYPTNDGAGCCRCCFNGSGERISMCASQSILDIVLYGHSRTAFIPMILMCINECIGCDHVINLSTLALSSPKCTHTHCLGKHFYTRSDSVFLPPFSSVSWQMHEMDWLTVFGLSFISISICWFDLIVVIRAEFLPTRFNFMQNMLSHYVYALTKSHW